MNIRVRVVRLWFAGMWLLTLALGPDREALSFPIIWRFGLSKFSIYFSVGLITFVISGSKS